MPESRNERPIPDNRTVVAIASPLQKELVNCIAAADDLFARLSRIRCDAEALSAKVTEAIERWRGPDRVAPANRLVLKGIEHGPARIRW